MGVAGETGLAVEGAVFVDGTPRLLQIDGIPVEAQLEGTILYISNRDEPGVVGHVCSALGKLGVNIATLNLGRRTAQRGADAVLLIRVDGEVTDAILQPIRAIAAITGAKLIRLN
jgi:D-3-phosphoglycerate dehydrogenase